MYRYFLLKTENGRSSLMNCITLSYLQTQADKHLQYFTRAPDFAAIFALILSAFTSTQRQHHRESIDLQSLFAFHVDLPFSRPVPLVCPVRVLQVLCRATLAIRSVMVKFLPYHSLINKNICKK